MDQSETSLFLLHFTSGGSSDKTSSVDVSCSDAVSAAVWVHRLILAPSGVADFKGEKYKHFFIILGLFLPGVTESAPGLEITAYLLPPFWNFCKENHPERRLN
jgi:hypothetical protein